MELLSVIQARLAVTQDQVGGGKGWTWDIHCEEGAGLADGLIAMRCEEGRNK